MQLFKKKFLLIFLFFYLIIGSLASINTGISFDERYEELNWKFNTTLSKDLTSHIFLNKKLDQNLQQEYKSYLGYGIGFQIISQPIQSFIKHLLKKNKKISYYGAKLVSKHLVVFLFFCFSGIFFYLILKKIIKNKFFCSFSTIIYLLYPYLFGQALFSPKDVPFMSVWLTCTYFCFNIFEKLVEEKKIKLSLILIFSLITSYLLSIRIAGILILIQYFLALIIFLNVKKINLFFFIKKFISQILFFFISTILFTILFYPMFWLNPLLVFDAIKIMSQHFNNVCTNTLGTCMYSQDLPSTYIPIWLSVKLPLLILLGLFLIPFTEKKIFHNKKNNIFFGTILGTSITIPLILIFSKVHLYDELRQVMFLLPLFFILGLVSLYIFSKKIYYTLGILSVSLFLFENIKINPYQYVWFNLPSRYMDLTKNFELEYQGLSGKEIAKYLSNSNIKNLCILANPLHSVRPFLNPQHFKCFDIWQKIDSDYKRPFLAVQNVRNIKKGTPYKCKVLYESGFRLLLHEKRFVTGKLLKCN